MVIEKIFEKVFSPDYKSRSTYYVGAIILAGITHYLMNSHGAVVPADMSPVKIIAELKAAGVDNIDVGQVIELSNKMRDTAESVSKISPDSTIGIWAAAAVAALDGAKRMFVKYQEVQMLMTSLRTGVKFTPIDLDNVPDHTPKIVPSSSPTENIPEAVTKIVTPSSIKIPE